MMINKIKTQEINRAPIITIVGHIDHGKTTLLKYIRKEKKVEKEHGDITQYIKPYYVKTKYGQMTFLDTPGHFAFNSIRIKSVKYSDIVLLIIAADDGVKPQTIESIEIVKKFEKSIIIVINKIDKTIKDNEKIINELVKYNLTPEKWGGDILMTNISAKTGEGVNDLLDLIKLQAEMLDLKANINSLAKGFVLDNKIDKGRGSVATIITLNGTLKKGDIVKIKNQFGRVKTITDETGNEVQTGKLSSPLCITGLSSSIEIGETFSVVESVENIKSTTMEKKKKIYNITDLIKNIKTVKKIKLNIIIKADTQGSINVLNETLNKIQTDKIDINVIKLEIGDFNKSDIDLALTSDAILIGFNIRCNTKIKKIAENNLIQINIFNIIYEIIDHIKSTIDKKSTVDTKDNYIGIANVKKVFNQTGINVIAGCSVIYGKIKQGSNIKIFRKNVLIHKGVIESIKIFKADTKEVKAGHECGIVIKNHVNIQINDKIKAISSKE